MQFLFCTSMDNKAVLHHAVFIPSNSVMGLGPSWTLERKEKKKKEKKKKEKTAGRHRQKPRQIGSNSLPSIAIPVPKQWHKILSYNYAFTIWCSVTKRTRQCNAIWHISRTDKKASEAPSCPRSVVTSVLCSVLPVKVEVAVLGFPS